MNYTYLLRCADGTLYCGWTNHLKERIQAHNEGKGAKYTKCRRPVELIYYEVFGTKQEAMRREVAIKRMSRKEKLSLAHENPLGDGYLPCSDSQTAGNMIEYRNRKNR